MRKSTIGFALALAVASSPLSANDTGTEAPSKLETNTNPKTQKNVDLTNLPTDMEYLFPLSPEEKIEIRERQLKDQNATYKPLRDVNPIRELKSISGNADSIPEVLVTPDYPSAIVFTDITGKPWPIEFIGQTGSLATVQRPEGSDNSIVLMANNGAGRKSVSVFLEGLTLPVTITVTGRNNEYHALKHIRVTERGPNTTVEQGVAENAYTSAKSLNPDDGETDGLDGILNKIAYKVTPDGYKKLRSTDSRVDAWISKTDKKYMLVRTDYRIVTPSPRAGNRGVTPIQNNMKIYMLPRINPIMALDESGQRKYLSFRE